MQHTMRSTSVNKFSIGILALSIESISCGKFSQKLQGFIKDAAESRVKLVVLPEISYTPILNSMDKDIFKATLFLETEVKKLAQNYSLYICGGSGIYNIDGKVYNQAFLALPNGEVIYQTKINLTESEKRLGRTSGNKIKIIATSFVKMAICTCYDVEFPELVRRMVLAGADLILTPTHTENQFGEHRVRFCAQARAIENHIYVASASLVGNNGPELSATGSGRAILYSPIDQGFNFDGVVTQSNYNQEHLLIANVDLGQLYKLRRNCSTSPLMDYKNFSKQQVGLEYYNFT